MEAQIKTAAGGGQPSRTLMRSESERREGEPFARQVVMSPLSAFRSGAVRRGNLRTSARTQGEEVRAVTG